MSVITCPGCGGQFPLAAVAAYETFTCSTCGHVVQVPVAPPAVVQPIPVQQPVQPAAPPAARPAAPPPAQTRPTQSRPAQARPAQAKPPQPRTAQPSPAAARPAAAQKPATRRAPAAAPEPAAEKPSRSRRGGGRRGRDDGGGEKDGPPLGLIVGGGLVVVAGLAALLVLNSGDDPATGTPDAAPEVASATTGTATGGDPDKDPAAWRALDEATRRDKIAMILARAESADEGTVRQTVEFLRERGEQDTLMKVARRYVERDSGATWANELIGREEAVAQIRRVLRSCELADEVEVAPVLRLRDLLRDKTDDGKNKEWWAEGEELARVKTLLAEVEAADKELNSSEAAYGRARWIAYQRKVEVIKDYPTLHGYVGPYLIFVQVDAKAGTKLADADPANVQRAREILDKNLELFRNLYEGWQTEMAPHFGFKRYDENSVSQETILKANVFANHDSYMEYNARNGMGGTASQARAYYSKQEPRFICTYDGTPVNEGEAERESPEYVNQVQCHEATHQLVHFFTWDITREAIGREPRWLDSLTRPLWSTEGFAEFFSSHKVENGVYKWMQPLDNRMQQLWILGEIVQEKGWKPWPMDQILSLRNGGQLNGLGAARANDPKDQGRAANVMSNLFYAEAWSLVHFLWFGNDAKYREQLVSYFKREFEMDYGQSKGGELARSPRLVTEKTFREAFGLESDSALQGLYEEWKVWEKAFVAKHKTPEWDKERAKLRKMIGVD